MSGGYRTEGAVSLWELLGLGGREATDWMRFGLCAQTDPGAFYPDRGENATSAKTVCAGCPVRAECLVYALEHHERFGVWGGTSERERRALHRRMAAAAAVDRRVA